MSNLNVLYYTYNYIRRISIKTPKNHTVVKQLSIIEKYENIVVIYRFYWGCYARPYDATQGPTIIKVVSEEPGHEINFSYIIQIDIFFCRRCAGGF